jgi:hypothetical protein
MNQHETIAKAIYFLEKMIQFDRREKKKKNGHPSVSKYKRLAHSIAPLKTTERMYKAQKKI